MYFLCELPNFTAENEHFMMLQSVTNQARASCCAVSLCCTSPGCARSSTSCATKRLPGCDKLAQDAHMIVKHVRTLTTNLVDLRLLFQQSSALSADCIVPSWRREPSALGSAVTRTAP